MISQHLLRSRFKPSFGVQTPLKSWLFQASLRNCLNCVHNCDDHGLLDLLLVNKFLWCVDLAIDQCVFMTCFADGSSQEVKMKRERAFLINSRSCSFFYRLLFVYPFLVNTPHKMLPPATAINKLYYPKHEESYPCASITKPLTTIIIIGCSRSALLMHCQLNFI